MKQIGYGLFFWILILGFVLGSCRRKPSVGERMNSAEKGIYFSDIDQHAGFIDLPVIKRSPVAHSGQFVSFADPQNPYSFGLSNKFGNLVDQPVSRVRFTAWVWLPSLTADAKLVLEMRDLDGKVELWEGAPVKDSVKKAKVWTKVTVELNLNKDGVKRYHAGKQVLGYLFCTAKEEVLIDDLMFEFLNG